MTCWSCWPGRAPPCPCSSCWPIARPRCCVCRRARFAWLHGPCPALGPAPRLREDLDQLSRLELMPLDTPEPELTYLFKHVVTQEVAYESLAQATRATLHEQLATYMERQA